MTTYRLTRTADAVLSGIDEYASLHFGEAQADAYLLDWDRIFVLLSRVPSMGAALRAVADDGDLLGLDEVEIGITIVIDAHLKFLPLCLSC